MDEHPDVTMTVVSSGGERQVGGRVAEMIRWLLRFAEDINASPQGNVVFSFTHETLKPSRQLFDEEIRLQN